MLRKEWIWDWKQEACPGFHAVYTAVLILRRITGNDRMVGCRKRSNTGGRGYGQNHPYMQCRGSRRAFTTAGAPFHAVSRHEKGLLDNSFPFSLSHMHYVGRSFRLLNQFSRPSPAHSERFSGRKFHRTEIFCRKPEGKRADPRGRRNFDEEGEKSLVP